MRQRPSNIIPCTKCGAKVGENCTLVSPPVMGARRRSTEDARFSLVNHPVRNRLFNQLLAESGLSHGYQLYEKVMGKAIA